MREDSDSRCRKLRFRREIAAARHVVRSLDLQTVVVLISAAVVVILQMKFGSRGFFRTEVAAAMNIESPGLPSWAWWFVAQGFLGFVLPVLLLRYGFKQKPIDMGLGLGDWRFAGFVALLYLPIVLIGTWILSGGSEFQAIYPHYAPASVDWGIFAVYELLFVFYWIGWEYLWRGFVLFGTARVFGVYAIFVQALPFAILHFEKPAPEALLSIVGGVALGALVWRARSFWIAVPIHAVQMLSLDFFCSLRIRSGVTGFGPGSFIEMFQRAF